MNQLILDKTIVYTDCGCTGTRQYVFDKDNLDMDALVQMGKDLNNGIKGKCPKCEEFDKLHHMVRTVVDGDYDWSRKTYIFATKNIREVIRYCYKKEILLHDEHYPVYSMYDCTGQVCHISAKVWRCRGFILVRNTAYRDL